MERMTCVVFAFLFLALQIDAQVPFTAGNIVVYRVGTGSSGNLGNAAAPVFLDEYTTSGALVQSIAMPTTASGGDFALTAAGTGNTEGILTLSNDGQYLVFTGYNAPVGTIGVGGTASTTRSRTIGLVRYDADINTSTSLTDLSSGSFVRCAVTTNGTDLWACGAGAAGTTGGVRYTTVGASTSTQLTDPTTSTSQLRSLCIRGGQLHLSGTGNAPRVGMVGTGLPTTAGQTVTNLPGMSETSSPGQIILLDLDAGVPGHDVLYCTNDINGIEKFSLVSGSWVSNGSVGASVDDYRGFTAIVSAGNVVTLYSTKRGANNTNIKGGQVVSLTDASGYNGAFSATPVVLITAVTNQSAFRGVAPAPVFNALPVKLISFTTGKINKDVRLNWSATEAVNFSHFEVERSMDGMTFSVIGKVDFQQTANSIVSYNFTDAGILNNEPTGRKLYYRLKMIDFDGHVDHSKIAMVSVEQNGALAVKAYPAPFNNEIIVKTETLRTGTINLSLSDVWGRVLRSMKVSLPRGENTIYFYPPAQLLKGTYFLRVHIDDRVTTLKLNKQ